MRTKQRNCQYCNSATRPCKCEIDALHPIYQTVPKFTKKEWGEIYYAVASKKIAVETGELGPSDTVTKRWIKDLNQILAKLRHGGMNVARGNYGL